LVVYSTSDVGIKISPDFGYCTSNVLPTLTVWMRISATRSSQTKITRSTIYVPLQNIGHSTM